MADYIKVAQAAEQFGKDGKVFVRGCSEMIREAYKAGGVTIPETMTANTIMQSYPAVTSPSAGDIAGWTADPHGHVCIYLGPSRFSNCRGENEATRIQSDLGHPLKYVRPA